MFDAARGSKNISKPGIYRPKLTSGEFEGRRAGDLGDEFWCVGVVWVGFDVGQARQKMADLCYRVGRYLRTATLYGRVSSLPTP